jgi:acetylornithine deacetylase/succinyl-diaminopimelate desuccinylase-like protein
LIDSTVSAVDESITEERCAELLTELIRIRSVNGEKTAAHLWLTDRLEAIGMTVEHYGVEDLPTPLVLASLTQSEERPGVLFDGHYDTVFAVPEDWTYDPWSAHRDGDVVYGRGAVDSKGCVAAMIAALEAIVDARVDLRGPLYYMSDSDGERAFRGPPLLRDLGLPERIGTIVSGEATSNRAIDIAYPGISAWKVTAIGRTAHPTEPEHGINAIEKMAKLVQAVEGGRLNLREGTSHWFKPRVTTNAIRTLPGGGWSIPARCDAVLSILSPIGVTLSEVGEDVEKFLRELEAEDGEVRFEHKVLPMGGGRLWLRPGESDPRHPGIEALRTAVREVTGAEPAVRAFNGGWVDGAELMRANGDGSGFCTPACLVFGPGDFDLAHRVDECISIREVAQCARIYARAALELLA